MGWSTSLPVISLSGKLVWSSQKTSQEFEEKAFSDWINSIQAISVLQYCGNRKRKSSEKIALFMCDNCEYSSESKSDIFEHFMKSHVFLCELCSYAGLSRSCVLKHCLESHERVVRDKLKCIKAYGVNVHRLITELGASSKQFDDDLYDLPGSKPLFHEGDYSSDDDISKSSFLVQNRIDSSDMETDIEVGPFRNNASSHSGDKINDGLVHFLDQTSSSGHKKSQHFENEYNELSDSNQMELFFSSEGNENDPDLSESIFHDHKEMFMVSRLPFPIRQDDSPNEPMLNEPNLPLESPSILQTILQKDKLDLVNGPSPTCSTLSSEKNCEVADIPQSISPGLSLPSGETLQKQLEAVIPKSPDFTPVDTQMNNTENKAMQSVTNKEITLSSKTFVNVDDGDQKLNENQNEVVSLSGDGPSKDGVVDNFLFSPILKTETDDKETRNENKSSDSMLQNDSTDTNEKFTLLRNLLKDKHGSNNAANKKKETGEFSERDDKTDTSSSNLKSLTLRNASNMSLLQLLSMDIPFPLLASKTGEVAKSSNDNAAFCLSTSTVLKCNLCKLDFINQSILDDHMKLCNNEKQQTSTALRVTSNLKLLGHFQNKPPPLHSNHMKSSLVTDKWTASKMLSKFSDYHTKATLKNKRFSSNFNSNNPVRRKKRFQSETSSRLGLKYRRSKMLNFTALKAQAKYKKRQSQDRRSLNADKDSFIRLKKKKTEQDDDYYPESESSESSEELTVDCLKQRKRSKRSRKHLCSFIRKPKMKNCVPASLTAKGCGPIAETLTLNLSNDSSRLSSSLSSLSSSLSQASASGTGITRVEKGNSFPSTSAKGNSIESEIRISETECSFQSTVSSNIKMEVVDQEEQLVHICQMQTNDQSFLSQHCSDKIKGSPNLLHHLLTNLPIRSGTIDSNNRPSSKQQDAQSLTVTKCIAPDYEQSSPTKIKLEVPPDETDDSNTCHGQRTQQKNQQNKSILNSILSGHSEYKANGSQSLKESDFVSNIRYCKDIKNHSSASSRLSASMMDIPDPPVPVPASLSKDEFCQQSSSSTNVSLFFSSLVSPSDNFVMLNKSQKQNEFNSALGYKFTQSDASLKSSPAPPALQPSTSSLSLKSEVCEDSRVPDLQRNDESLPGSLLRNLLTQPSTK